MTIWLVEIQLTFTMTSEPERWILGSDWGLRAFATNWINGLKTIMTRDANKITRLMGLTIMEANKNFKSNRLLRIFGRSNSILKTIVKYLNQLGMSGYSVSARIIGRSIQVTKNSKAVSSRILGTAEIILGYLVITRSTGKHCMSGEYTWLSIGVYRWKGIAKAMNTSSRVISGEYLQSLHVQQTIISNKGLSGWKW